jgi:hypothetical protein
MNKPILGTYSKLKLTYKNRSNFGKLNFESKHCNFFVYDKKSDIYDFDKFVSKPTDAQNTKLKSLNTQLVKATDSENDSKIKSIKTKMTNLNVKMEGIMKCKKYEFFPNDKQKQLIKDIVNKSNICYDKCVEMYNKIKNIQINRYRCICTL